MNSWDDAKFVAAVQKSDRKKIVLAGLWTETCVALPTVQAIHDGYEIYVVEDCCGDVSQLAHDNALAVLPYPCRIKVVESAKKDHMANHFTGWPCGPL